jgi:hypothetical protein
MIVGRVGQKKAAGLWQLAGGKTQAQPPQERVEQSREVDEMTPNELIGLRHLLKRAGFDCEKGKF